MAVEKETQGARFMPLACLVACLVVVPPQAPPALGADGGIRLFSTPESASCWLHGGEPPRIFACLPEARRIVEFDARTGEELRRLDPEGQPGEAVVVAGCLGVLVTQGAEKSAVQLIDLETGAKSHRLPLDFEAPLGMCSSAADGRAVWAFGRISGLGNLWNLVRIDARSGKKLQTFSLTDRNDTPANLVFSADGLWLLAHYEDTFVRLFRVDLARGEIESAFDFETESGVARADPWGRYWTIGNDLYDVRFRGVKRRFAGAPIAVHPHLDLAASLLREGGHHRLSFQTASEAGPIAMLDLPVTFDEHARSLDWKKVSGDDHPELSFEAAGKLLFVAWSRHAAIIDLERAGIQGPSCPRFAIPSRHRAISGLEWRLPLRLADESLSASTRRGLVEAPAGLELRGNELVWTPDMRDVGVHEVTVTLSADGKEDRAAIVLEVSLPRIELGGEARQVDLSPAADRAVVVGGLVEEDPLAGDPPLPSDVLLLDCRKLTVLARRRFDEGVLTAHVDEQAVWVVTGRMSTKLRVLSREDLTESLSLEVSSPQLALGWLSTSESVSLLYDSIVETYPREEIESARKHGGLVHPRRRTRSPVPRDEPAFERTCETFAPEAEEGGRSVPPRPLLDRARFPELPYLVVSPPSVVTLPWRPWGRRRMHGGVVANQPSHQEELVSWSDGAGRVLDRYPAAVSASVEPLDDARGARLELRVHELVEGSPVEDFLLEDGSGADAFSPERSSPGREPPATTLDAEGTTVAVAFRRRLYLRALDTKRLEALARPFELERHPTLREVSLGSVSLALSCHGQTGPVEYHLLAAMEGIRLEGAELRVALLDIWRRFVKVLPLGGVPGETTERFLEALRLTSSEYLRVTGRLPRPDRVPIVLPLWIEAVDPGGSTDRARFDLLFLAPRNELLEALAGAPLPPPKPAMRAVDPLQAQDLMPPDLRTILEEKRKELQYLLDAMRVEIRRLEALDRTRGRGGRRATGGEE